MPGLVVFHTSDLHGRLTLGAAGRLREIKSSHPHSLMLDSGDALKSGNVYWLPKEPILELMNSVPYDAMCMGNREYHLLRVGIAAKTAQAQFPVLSANLRSAKHGSKPPAEPYVVFERAGIRIGVMGLTVPCVTERMFIKRLADYYFESPLKAAQTVVPELRGLCDVLIALTHLPSGTDSRIAAEVPEIDIILSGHSHSLAEPESVGTTTILRHGAYGRQAGKVAVAVEDGRVSVTNELIPLRGE